MTDPGLSWAPIPYQAVHHGPRRVLQLRLRRALKNVGAVHVNIDGSPYVLGWGPAAFEIPADRPVTVRVHQFDVLQRTFGSADVVLAPEAPAELEYQAPGPHVADWRDRAARHRQRSRQAHLRVHRLHERGARGVAGHGDRLPRRRLAPPGSQPARAIWPRTGA